MNIQEMLFHYEDKEYAIFQSKLTPGIPVDSFIGVRVPDIRKIAKTLVSKNCYEEFLNHLPHTYFDENMLHGAIINEIKDYESCMIETEKFLPYVDNWAVCDTMSPKIFKKQKDNLLSRIKIWCASNETYTCRFGMKMLMSHFLDENFKPEYLELPACVISEEYYVNMMIAWFFATALAKQWESAIQYIESFRLDQWVHNKTIQKACESYRITPEQKKMLKQFKI